MTAIGGKRALTLTKGRPLRVVFMRCDDEDEDIVGPVSSGKDVDGTREGCD